MRLLRENKGTSFFSNDAGSRLVYFFFFLRGDVDLPAEVDFFFEPDFRRRLTIVAALVGFWKERSDLAIMLRLSRTAGGNHR